VRGVWSPARPAFAPMSKRNLFGQKELTKKNFKIKKERYKINRLTASQLEVKASGALFVDNGVTSHVQSQLERRRLEYHHPALGQRGGEGGGVGVGQPFRRSLTCSGGMSEEGRAGR